jgi:hypothetical protein
VSNAGSADSRSSPTSSFNSSQQLHAQRKLFAESRIGRSSFQKLLEPKLPHLPGIAPYRVVLGNVKDKVSLLIYFNNIVVCIGMNTSISFLLLCFYFLIVL